MDGIVFAVYGQEGVAGFFYGGHDEFASGDKDFFVGKGDGTAELDGFVGCGETDHTDGGGNYDFGVRVSGDGVHAFLAVMDGRHGDSLFAEPARKFVSLGGVGYGDKFRVVAFDLRNEFVEIRAGGEGQNFELPGERFDDS